MSGCRRADREHGAVESHRRSDGEGTAVSEVVRFVALGDSVTAGIGDPVPDGGWRGWAVLLAESLAPAGRVRCRNLARTGALTGDVLRDQLPAALAERPDVAAVLVGINDTLRATFDVAAVAANLDAVVGTLVSSGAVVLTAKMPDPGQMLRLPRALARPLARRARALGAVTDGIAARYRTCHLDLAARSDVYAREMWSVDRLHPSERGHRALAYLYATMLREAGLPVHRLPDRTAGNPPPTRRAEVRWMATSGVRWVAVRSTDLLPYLTRMAVTEWWHQVRGIAQRLDIQLEQEVARVLAVGDPAGVDAR
jgi:lysophospholipase L1-like esterase